MLSDFAPYIVLGRDRRIIFRSAPISRLFSSPKTGDNFIHYISPHSLSDFSAIFPEGGSPSAESARAAVIGIIRITGLSRAFAVTMTLDGGETVCLVCFADVLIRNPPFSKSNAVEKILISAGDELAELFREDVSHALSSSPQHRAPAPYRRSAARLLQLLSCCRDRAEAVLKRFYTYPDYSPAYALPKHAVTSITYTDLPDDEVPMVCAADIAGIIAMQIAPTFGKFGLRFTSSGRVIDRVNFLPAAEFLFAWTQIAVISVGATVFSHPEYGCSAHTDAAVGRFISEFCFAPAKPAPKSCTDPLLHYAAQCPADIIGCSVASALIHSFGWYLASYTLPADENGVRRVILHFEAEMNLDSGRSLFDPIREDFDLIPAEAAAREWTAFALAHLGSAYEIISSIESEKPKSSNRKKSKPPTNE